MLVIIIMVKDACKKVVLENEMKSLRNRIFKEFIFLKSEMGSSSCIYDRCFNKKKDTVIEL